MSPMLDQRSAHDCLPDILPLSPFSDKVSLTKLLMLPLNSLRTDLNLGFSCHFFPSSWDHRPVS